VAEASIIIAGYDPSWPREFAEIGAKLRGALGATALRIDHVGSTSVPGLDAKSIIDIQVSVLRLEPPDSYFVPLESLGYRFHASNPDLTKRFFREPPGTRRAHIHVRRSGSFDGALNLLFRDFLRSHPDASQEYAQAKYDLAARFQDDREGYVLAKGPAVWSILRRAHDWAQASGWSPGEADA
jgi:GrpB-like predicted nucleotidyltransferase (UPF0157 family)